MRKISYDYLVNHPEFTDEVTKHWQAEWASDKSETGFAKQKASIAKKLYEGSLPFIMIAFCEKVLIGTIALLEDDLESRPDLFPWIGGVFVHPEFRGRGIASQLIERVLKQAGILGFNKIYLHTEHTAGLYEKLGWQKLCDCQNDQGEDSTIYYFDL